MIIKLALLELKNKVRVEEYYLAAAVTSIGDRD